jgi:hypothetical protein
VFVVGSLVTRRSAAVARETRVERAPVGIA